MKITLDRKNLLNELSFVNGLTDGSVNPNHTAVLFEINDNKLILTATNGTAVVTSEVTITNKDKNENFAGAIKANKFIGLLQHIASDMVNMSFSTNNVTMTANKGRYSVGILDGAVPHIKSFSTFKETGKLFTIDSKGFIRGITTTAPFASKKESTQYTLRSIGIKATPNEVHFYATDSTCVFHMKIDDVDPLNVEREQTLKIDPVYMSFLSGLNSEERIEVRISDSIMSFKCGTRKLFLNILLGELPNIPDKIMPKWKSELNVTLKIDIGDFKEAVKRFEYAADVKFKRVIFSANDTALSMQAKDPFDEGVDFYDEVSLKEGANGSFVTDGKRISEFLNKLDSGTLINRFATTKEPVLFETENGLNYLVMQVE
jgi:DNA polymerase III sliding clamp (beta) subunit (PCNA family)